MARAATRRRSCSSSRAGERVDLVGGAHAHRNQAGQQIGGDREARALWNVIHLADDFDPVTCLAGEPVQQFRERLRGAFHARRHQAAGDYGGLQQAEIVAREIEDLGDRCDVCRGLQIHAGEAQHGLIDHAEVGFYRRLRCGIRRHSLRTARSMEMFSTRAPSGKSIPRKKMSLQPLCVRSMRTGVVSRRMGKTGAPVQKFAPQVQRVIGGMPGAEHPLVAAHAAHAAAHLVCQRLEGERFVTGGERTGDGGARAPLDLRRQEDIDGLFEAALQQVRVSREGNRRGGPGGGAQRNVEAVDRVEKEERAHAFVQIVASAAESIERLALGQQLFER